MYYDLIASLPQLPHFARAESSPITQLRLEQRLRRMLPEHANQLHRAQALVRWSSDRLLGQSDAAVVRAYATLVDSALDSQLRDYVTFRMEQQTVLAALRRKRDALDLPDGTSAWGVGPRVHYIRRHWDAPDFALAHLYSWVAPARERLAAGDARGLDRVLMDVAWRWLTQCAERNMFGFEAVFAYVFKWDILQAWLVCDASRATIRFTDLINQVTHVEHN